MLNKNISVIIPVYNAAVFVAKAVASALLQPETAEVILIEDGSTDHSLACCRALAASNKMIHIYTHPGNVNKGAGLSRNLGIEKAACAYLAFLDADDVYLPDRFRAERKIFTEKPNTDGVYGALGFQYHTEAGRKKYQDGGFDSLTTLTEKVAPAELFPVLMGLHRRVYGYFSIDTLTVKKEIFTTKTAMFNGLKMHEDTVFFIQLSLNCKLEAGIIDAPIGLRGVHDENRIVNNPEKSGTLVTMWKYLYEWSVNADNGKPYSKTFKAQEMKERILLSGRFASLFRLVSYSLANHQFINKAAFFNPSSFYVFGKYLGRHVIKAKENVQCRFFKSDPHKIFTGFKHLEP